MQKRQVTIEKHFSIVSIKSILKQISTEDKKKLSVFLDKEIRKEEEYPSSFVPAQKHEKYSSICGLWEKTDATKHELRQKLWGRKNTF